MPFKDISFNEIIVLFFGLPCSMTLFMKYCFSNGFNVPNSIDLNIPISG